MKIDPLLPPQTAVGSESADQHRPPQRRDDADPLQQGSDVRINMSPTLQHIERMLSSSDVDRSRVEAIKQALASGQYHNNSERIASTLISSVLASLAKGDNK